MSSEINSVLIESASDLYCLIQEHIHDIGDIDYEIEELKHKRKTICNRLVRDCKKLSDIINNDSLLNNLNKEYIEDVKDAISYLNEICVDTK